LTGNFQVLGLAWITSRFHWSRRGFPAIRAMGALSSYVTTVPMLCHF